MTAENHPWACCHRASISTLPVWTQKQFRTNAGSATSRGTIEIKLMKPRCSWSGHLKISLVTVPIRVYTAVNNADKIAFNQLHKTCHQRIKQKLVCPIHGEVTREDLEKGYEYDADKFVVLSDTDLESAQIEATGTIELVQFVRPEELDPMYYLGEPNFLGPDGPVAEEGFAVLREALRRSKRIGIGQVALRGKEKLVALKPNGKGLVLHMLRYAVEVRSAAAYFEDLCGRPVDAGQIALAQKLIESKSSPLNLATFSDRYQSALLDIIKAKVAGTKPVLAPRRENGKVANLMEVLRQSLAQTDRSERASARRNGHKRMALAA
jgi:DNA end-binding protein Ku